MTEFETAIEQARELEDRVKQLYLQASQCDSGLVTLKLLFPSITLPKKGIKYYRGDLAVAIVRAVIPWDPFCEWTVWFSRKKKSKSGFNFKIKELNAYKLPGCDHVPLEFSTNYYYIYSNPGDMPF